MRDMEPALETRGLSKVFKDGDEKKTAVDDVSFIVEAGECVALVGQSGCGKSTIARIVCGLETPTNGAVLLEGEDISKLRGRKLRDIYRVVQMVFQNPTGSFDPRKTLGASIAEGLRNEGLPKSAAHERALGLLQDCGLSAEFAERYPKDVSGGQCQRAAIARALASEPRLIIFDEATSALDVTVQARIVEMLKDIQRTRHIAFLFICHDLALAQGFCERVLVMKDGKIVESGPTEKVLSHPDHPYTQTLIDAAPRI